MDEIRLTFPAQRPYFPVAHLVLGGLGARVELTVDGLDDLVVALDSLLEQRPASSDVTVALRIADGTLLAEVGPFASDELRAELEGAAPAELGVRRILDAVADGIEVREDEGGFWVTLAKRAGTG